MNNNCEKCRNELDDFLYGELDQSSAAAVRVHLESCAGCASMRDSFERENAVFALFHQQTGIEPSPESWDAVRDRISDEVTSSISSRPAKAENSRLAGLLAWMTRPVVLQQVAFAIVLIALSVATTLYFVRRQASQVTDRGQLAIRNKTLPAKPEPSPKPRPDEFAGGIVKPEPSPERTVRPYTPPPKSVSERDQLAMQVARAEREYMSAIRLLDRAIEKRRDEIDPLVMQQYQASLALIDESIQSSRDAFRQNRSDLNASQFLIAAYNRKVELMQEIAMR